MLQKFDSQKPVIPCDTDTWAVVEAAKNFISSGYTFKAFVAQAWMEKWFETATYWDGTNDKAKFEGNTEEERFANWLKWVCQQTDISDSIRSSIFNFCVVVLPLTEANLIATTSQELMTLEESKGNRVTSVVRNLLNKYGPTPEIGRAIDQVVEVARTQTSAGLEAFLEANGLKKGRNQPKDEIMPMVSIIDANNGTVFVIEALDGTPQYEKVMKFVADMEVQYRDPEELFPELTDRITNGLNTITLKSGHDSEEGI